MKVSTIFEDENMMAVEKPAGVLVYHLPGETSIDETTLLDMVKPKLSFKNPNERSGIVHRLDRETSGIILIAKNEKTEEALKKLFKDRNIKKTYLALVHGKVTPDVGEVAIPLGRGSKDRLRVVPNEQGKESRTRYQVLKYFPKTVMSLLSVDLLTGRTHQIRVHMSAIGHPVVGDAKYANRKSDLKRQFLHAAELKFTHPFTGEEIDLKSDLPNDLKAYLNVLEVV